MKFAFAIGGLDFKGGCGELGVERGLGKGMIETNGEFCLVDGGGVDIIGGIIGNWLIVSLVLLFIEPNQFLHHCQTQFVIINCDEVKDEW